VCTPRDYLLDGEHAPLFVGKLAPLALAAALLVVVARPKAAAALLDVPLVANLRLSCALNII